MTDIKQSDIKAPTKDEFDLAVKVSDVVMIEDVRLLNSKCHQHPKEISEKNTFKINHDAEIKIDHELSILFVIAHFSFNGYASEDISKKPFVKIEASFLLTYKAENIRDLDEKNFEAFAKLNGIYNAWPYWREYLQNILARMALPHLTIPVFRLLNPQSSDNTNKNISPDKVD